MAFYTPRKAALEEAERSRGALDQSQSYLASITQMAPMRPRTEGDGSVNQSDLFRLQQSGMLAVPGQENAFRSPEEIAAINEIRQAQQLERLARDRFERDNRGYGDVLAEVGNTAMAPVMALLGGDMKPFGDPSQEQLSRYQQALLASNETAKAAFDRVTQARIDRSAAISGALRKPMGLTPLADGTMGMAYDDQGTPAMVSMGEGSRYAAKVMTGPGGIPIAVSNTSQGPQATSTLTPGQVVAQETSAAVGEVAGDEVKADAQAVYDAPTAVQQFQRNIAEVEYIIAGADSFTGANDMNLITKLQPGTDHYDFVAAVDKVKGNVFLEAFQGLKGGGPITDTEGKAATQARAQLDTGQSPKQFKAQAEAYRDILLKGLDKALRDASRDIENMDVFERQREIKRLRGELNMTPGGQP